MLYGLYLSTMGLKTQESRLDIIANNLANTQTTGFKRDLAIMRTRANASLEDPAMAPYHTPIYGDQGGGTWITSAIDLSQGSLRVTGNATDLALVGPGFFTVQGNKPGEKLLTRDGQLALNNDGTLVTTNGGRPVLSSTGEPIRLNPTLPLQVQSDGSIRQGDTSVPLGVVNVTDPRRLIKVGGNLLTVDQPDALTDRNPATLVRQGQLESSGADPIIEMVNMTAGQRAFDANARLLSYQDNALSELNTIGRVA